MDKLKWVAFALAVIAVVADALTTRAALKRGGTHEAGKVGRYLSEYQRRAVMVAFLAFSVWGALGFPGTRWKMTYYTPSWMWIAVWTLIAVLAGWATMNNSKRGRR